MPQHDPRHVVARLTDAINAHDLAAAGELCAPDARFVSAGGRQLDLAGMAELLRQSLHSFPDLTVGVTRWVVEGEVVVTEELMTGTHRGTFAGIPATGRRVELPMVHVTCVAGGRVVDRRTYHDTAGVLRQLSQP